MNHLAAANQDYETGLYASAVHLQRSLDLETNHDRQSGEEWWQTVNNFRDVGLDRLLRHGTHPLVGRIADDAGQLSLKMRSAVLAPDTKNWRNALPDIRFHLDGIAADLQEIVTDPEARIDVPQEDGHARLSLRRIAGTVDDLLDAVATCSHSDRVDQFSRQHADTVTIALNTFDDPMRIHRGQHDSAQNLARRSTNRQSVRDRSQRLSQLFESKDVVGMRIEAASKIMWLKERGFL